MGGLGAEGRGGSAHVIVTVFDWLEARWEGARVRRLVASLLIAGFLLGLLVIELGRRGLLPAAIARAVPRSHFQAIELAFYLLLAYEVIGLVFGISRSVANAAGKQLEIFSLILLRHAFEVFSNLDEPLRWEQLRPRVPEMLSNGAGAVAIFVLIGFYYKLQRHRPAPGDPRDRRAFIVAKKAIALALLALFTGIGLRSVVSHALRFERPHDFFEQFYTLLIFADILVVLFSLRYSSTYQVVFRNSGLAVATVLLRIALAAPAFVNTALGIAAALLALTLTAAYNAFTPSASAEKAEVGVVTLP
jgi:hypothetical protein